MISAQKQSLRTTIRARLALWNADQMKSASVNIRKSLTSLKEWEKAEVIALFYPLASEPDCLRGQGLKDKTYCFPRVIGEELSFHAISSVEDLQPGSFQIHEPDFEKHPCVALEKIALVVIPGLAFDAAGHRLGRGKGYYDRALARMHPSVVKVGVCFACQMVEAVPCEQHDIRVDHVISA